jgi:hypothetical protein
MGKSPEIKADLKKLSAIPDHVIRKAARAAWVEQMAEMFQVPVVVAEMRLEGTGPFLGKRGQP